MFKLEKLYIHEDNISMLPGGYSTVAPDILLYKYDTNERKEINNVQEVEPGWQVILTDRSRINPDNYHRTSKIREIVLRGDSHVIFDTETSRYMLEQQ